MALQKIVPLLPEGFPCPVLIAQHMPPLFTKYLADRLNTLSRLTVKEAEANEVIAPGRVLIAPGGRHMTVAKVGARYEVRLSQSPANLHHKPSVDVLMASVAVVYRSRAAGVILTGMGHDGRAME